jgi:DNA-binding response OmpR family regulator
MHILLIEDDLALGRALQSVLHNEGHRATWVRLGVDAARLLAESRFDAMLLDLSLPDVDGIDLLRQLREGGCAVPALVITARDSLEERLRGFDGGADDYLVKPFEIPELLARLRAVVRRSTGRADDPLWALRDLTLDVRKMSVARDGNPIALSKTEFALLHTLVRYADRIVTRSELEIGVLPYSEGQTLDVHMSNLRRKIGDGYIRTVRGVGYMVQHGAA